MLERVFEVLDLVDAFYWRYIGVTFLLVVGLYISYKSGFYQVRVLRHLPSTVRSLMSYSKKDMPGVSPIRLYFASIGGMIGLGNIVVVMVALTVGGPGALFWLWVAAFVGMILKYAEIYLGMQYRVMNKEGGYDGGPMYTLPAAFGGRLGRVLACVAAVLLCIYGVEIAQFTIIADTFAANLPGVNEEFIIIGLLAFVVYTGLGGVRRLAALCTFMMPLFIGLYVLMSLWVIGHYIGEIPGMLMVIVKSAFTGHAAVGGFAGSTLLIAAQQGAARAVYSGDIAIGFDSIIQSESKALNPVMQARLAIMSIITDASICTISIVTVYLTGLWQYGDVYQSSEFVPLALGKFIPHSDKLIVLIVFLAGFTTIQAYFVVGVKSAKFLSPRFGRLIYFIFAIISFYFFAHFEQEEVILIMSLSGGGLILLNLSGIIKLRNKIRFDILKEDKTD